MIALTVSISLAPEKRDEVLRLLCSVKEPILVKPDCCNYKIHQDAEDMNSLILIEEWKNLESMERHIRSEDFRKILTAMDLAIAPPEIKFYMRLFSSGLEFISDTLMGEEKSIEYRLARQIEMKVRADGCLRSAFETIEEEAI